MRLSELHAKFVTDGSLQRVGVTMDCPCGCEAPLYVPFADPTVGCNWARTGDTIEMLTLNPSVNRVGGCAGKWHGWIRDGEAVSC